MADYIPPEPALAEWVYKQRLAEKALCHRLRGASTEQLKRLARDGFISGRSVKATGGARGRETSYALTARGRAALKELREFYRRMERQAGG